MDTNASSYLELFAGINIASSIIDKFTLEVLKIISPDVKKINDNVEKYQKLIKHTFSFGDNPAASDGISQCIRTKTDNRFNSITKVRSFIPLSFLATLHCIFMLIVIAFVDERPNMRLDTFLFCYCLVLCLFITIMFTGEFKKWALKYLGGVYGFGFAILLGIFTLGIATVFRFPYYPKDWIVTFFILFVPIFHILLYIYDAFRKRKLLAQLTEEVNTIFMDCLDEYAKQREEAAENARLDALSPEERKKEMFKKLFDN